ncbi:uncharacterized protein LOC119672782 [Teleopsis dalmanni]|uniref:uncharacterized protein LOC119672782 n=1 Tax=Teleopsis dalmanni TaxID=139649 RepID=UPI0018CDAEDB|nr:uncharacterized protein LOC119672782 [Teleopsis dalmanni]
MPADIADIVNIIETNVNNEQRFVSDAEEVAVKHFSTNAGSGSGSGSGGSMRLSKDTAEEILFAEPTFSERFKRYLVVVIYFCGLCGLGFFLSVYHLFFWDSKMPPVYKPTNKKPVHIY